MTVIKKNNSADIKKAYVRRMRDKGWFYLCRWVRLEKKQKAIEAIEKLNR